MRQARPTNCVSPDRSLDLSEPGETGREPTSLSHLARGSSYYYQGVKEPQVTARPPRDHSLGWAGCRMTSELYPGDQPVFLEGRAPLALSLGPGPYFAGPPFLPRPHAEAMPSWQCPTRPPRDWV